MRLQKYECFILLLSLFTSSSSGLNSPLFPSLTTNSNGIIVPRVSAGPISISAIGCGTWSWGNRLLFDYNPSQDEEIYSAYRIVRDGGVTLFDTADSYGTLDLNGRAEILLGEFERRYQMEKNDEKSGSLKFFPELLPTITLVPKIGMTKGRGDLKNQKEI